MKNELFYILGGIGIAIIGYCHVVNQEFARKLLVGRGILKPWNPSPTAERIGLIVIRFIVGPTLILVGTALIFKGIT